MRLGIGLGLGVGQGIKVDSLSARVVSSSIVGATITDVSAWTPASLTTRLKLWLRGDLGVTLVSGKVSLWADQSGNGNDYAQSVALARVTPATAINSQATLHGLGAGGNNNYLLGPSFAGLTASHFFIVLKATDNVGPYQLESFGNGGGDYFPYLDGHGYLSIGSQNRPDVGIISPHADVAQVLETISTSSKFTVKQNGTQLYTDAGETVGWNSAGSTLFCGTGANSSTPTGFWPGDIAEVIMTNAEITGADLVSLKSYLTARYALVIA